uniref:Uncharacterized protein n=1 Tax=Anguilla anguilla TaxID=7936 RepID=A0A0E9UC33_ANGAN
MCHHINKHYSYEPPYEASCLWNEFPSTTKSAVWNLVESKSSLMATCNIHNASVLQGLH